MADYADSNYYQPDGPLAIAQTISGSNGKDQTIYIDAQTGQVVNNLNGYTVQDGDIYYRPTDDNKDGVIDTKETARQVDSAAKAQGLGTTRTDALGTTPGPKGTASNNFGYKDKPGWLGPAAMAAGLVNPGIGAVGGMVSKAYNVNNMEAVNEARIGLGLSPTSLGKRAAQAMKDNKGQIANVDIGDKKYSVGFSALSPDGKTNLTYNEAKQRAALASAQIKETPKDEVTPAPSFSNQKQSLVEKATGLQKGWLSKALTDLTGIGKVTPETAKALPEAVKAVPTTPPSPEASVGLSNKAPAPAAGLISHPDNPAPSSNSAASVDTGRPAPQGAIVDGSTPDHLGRVGLTSVNFDKMGLQPAEAAQMKSFQQKAIEQGIANKLSVDVTHMVRTPEQQAAIQAAGFSKTKLGYHNIGLAVDVSPTAINEKDQITDQETLDKSRALAQSLGMNTLSKSWDPAHIESKIPGYTAAQIASQPVDPSTGLPQLSPEQDLSVRQSSVPTPTPNPGQVAPEVDRNSLAQATPSSYSGTTPSTSVGEDAKTNTGNVANAAEAGGFTSQDERSSMEDRLGMTAPSVAPSQDTNAFGKMKESMDTLASNTTPSVPGAKLSNTPAGLAAMGFTNRTAQEKAAISRTIAGELGQKSLKALKSPDPAVRASALAEVGNMAATIENRAATTQFSGIAKTIAPSQYNSNMAKNAKVTDQNYANNPAVSKAVGQFYSGGIPGTNYGATNYHATAMAHPPSWSGKMTSVGVVGQHTFGQLPGYSPDAATQGAMKAFGTMAGTQYSAGKKTDDTVANPGFSGMGTPRGLSPSPSSTSTTSATTGLGRANPNSTPGYGGAGMGYGGIGSGASDAGTKGSTGGSNASSSSSGSSSSGSSGSSGSGSGSSGGSNGGNSNSRDGSSSPAGGYGSSASKGSTGGL